MICPDQCLAFSRELAAQALIADVATSDALLRQAERWLDVAMWAEQGNAAAMVRALESIIANDVARRVQ